MEKPLEGIRVLDLTRVLAGPFCTMQLADMGAEVIKIERPGTGDDSRYFGPWKNGESSYYILVNRGKKDITLNFREPRALELFYDMARQADVVVENFRPGVTRKLGLDYETLKKLNPRLIYASISGCGQYGPYSARPGYDIVAQAMGGLMSITGYPDAPPARAGSSIADISAGLYGATAIAATLCRRERTGEGDYIDVSLLDSVFSFCETNIVRYTIGGVIPQRVGSRHPLSAPFDIYRARDGYVVIAVANEVLMERLFQLMGRPELHRDPRFETDAKRSVHDKELKAILEDWLQAYTVEEAVKLLLDQSIPASPVLSIPEICGDPQIAARHMLVEVEQPQAGRVKITGTPMKFASSPDDDFSPAPQMGQDNYEVLGRLCHCSRAAVDEMLAKGIL